jgi:predicted metal-dependent peptidase
MKEPEVYISSEEMLALAFACEQHHAIFYKFWMIGKPIFTKEVKTAAVSFNEEGEYLAFMFNPDFWKRLSFNQRLFVISHECLHIIHNHGLRIQNLNNLKMANIAADLVVNHALVFNFGFDRQEADPEDKYCWIDNTFDPTVGVEYHKSFEYYYQKLMETTPTTKTLVDDHNWGKKKSDKKDGKKGDPNQQIYDFLGKTLDDETKKMIADYLDTTHPSASGNKAGTGAGDREWYYTAPKPPKKKKWETVIKNWALGKITRREQIKTQWVHKDRRFATFSSGKLMLPSANPIEAKIRKKDRIKVYFFLDTSGSCWHLKDRFFRAAKTLSEDQFEVILFCFDTKVYPTTLESGRAYGGGGTYFNIIEEEIQRNMPDGKYPEAVFIITDGAGTTVKPQKPHNWHWFLSENVRSYIPKESHVYMLKDYE